MNSQLRAQFPSLKRNVNGKPVIYLDGPAGTQVPQSVIDSISHYYSNYNANSHGQFENAQKTDQILEETREKLAKFLNAESRSCISYGANTTSLIYSLSHAIARSMKPGEEIIITQLDHESNRGPWLDLAKYYGMVIKEVNIKENGTLDLDHFKSLFSPKTHLVACGLASNIFGTVNPVKEIKALCMEHKALLLLDAVHYAPHHLIDVQQLDCDFLLCSVYKFYGPHVGILYCKPGLLDGLEPGRLRVQDQESPYRIETGTLNHAAIAGVSAAVDFMSSLGEGDDLRKRLSSAYQEISTYERMLAQKLYNGIKSISNCQIHGPAFVEDQQRCPTISFYHKKHAAEQVCKLLGDKGIFAWDGHFYAIRATEALGLDKLGGVTRMGISVYNTEEEIEKVLDVLKQLS